MISLLVSPTSSQLWVVPEVRQSQRRSSRRLGSGVWCTLCSLWGLQSTSFCRRHSPAPSCHVTLLWLLSTKTGQSRTLTHRTSPTSFISSLLSRSLCSLHVTSSKRVNCKDGVS